MENTETAHMKLVERTMIEAYDHDCPDGHAPGCQVIDRQVRYSMDGQEVNDPAIIARVEENIAAAGEEPWHM